MNERQRTELLDRIRRSSATVGRSIPETVRVDGESIPVRELYFEVSDRADLESEERRRVEDVLSYLRRERLRLVQRIENDDVDYERGTELASEIVDLKRAIDAFESLGEPGLAEQIRQERIDSARELVDLLRKSGKK